MAFDRWRSGKKDNDSNSSMTMADIIRGIQYCVNSSLEIVEQHYATFLKNFIGDDGKIITRQIYINDDYVMDLPDICLAAHNSLALDEMEVKMNLNIKSMDKKKAYRIFDENTKVKRRGKTESAKAEEFEVSRSSFDVELGSPSVDKDGSTRMEITMKFKAGDPPEAVSRLIDQLNNTIAVKYREKSEEKK